VFSFISISRCPPPCQPPVDLDKHSLSGGKFECKNIVAISSLVGFAIGTVGLGKIVGYTVPWLMLVYPAIIVLLVGGLFDFGKFKPAMQGGIVTAVLLSIGDFLAGMGFPGNALSKMTASLPLGAQGLGWVLPSLAAVSERIAVVVRKKQLVRGSSVGFQ